MSNLNISRAQRLDQYVVERNPLLSRMYAVTLIATGKVLVNNAASRPGYKVRPDDVIVIDYDNQQHLQIPRISMDILYEDDDVLVVDKPAGILSHSKGAFNPEATVSSFVRQHLTGEPTAGNVQESDANTTYDSWLKSDRVGIVHRLDRATSGVMICAKNHAALMWLQKQFSERKVHKTYIAIIHGHMTDDRAVIDMPLERNPKEPKKFRVGQHGKPAQTEYCLLEQTETVSLLELKPQTGRTHQLRVHLAHFKHPIVGDPLYGSAADLQEPRMYLHALHLELTLPNRNRMQCTAPLPKDFTKRVHNAS